MKLICLGDSQTFSLGLHRPDKWTTLLGQNLGSEWEVINAGINGDTTSGMLARVRYDVIEKKPDIVMVMGGGNDFIAGSDIGCVKANTMAIVQQCLAAGLKVILASELLLYPQLISDTYKKVADFEGVNSQLKNIALWYPDFCACWSGIDYVDLQNLYLEETGGSTDFSADGMHPNKAGAEIIAKILTKVFKVL
ncbi:MAG: GDSL-type esterase/lipase family protein [Lachnospiraceae bacterium]|nr:GDSL-type esterase/lipase family protein [Lachnospiraceae bacterium]